MQENNKCIYCDNYVETGKNICKSCYFKLVGGDKLKQIRETTNINPKKFYKDQIKLDFSVDKFANQFKKISFGSINNVSKIVRLRAFIIDKLAIAIISSIICFLGYPYYGISNKLVLIVLFIVYFLYYFVFETFFSKTLGKMECKVVTESGNKAQFYRILVRTVIRNLFIIDWISFLIDKRGLHDKLSNTYVVKKTVI